jgi:hypothetical protein
MYGFISHVAEKLPTIPLSGVPGPIRATTTSRSCSLQLLDRPLGYRTDSLLGMRVRLIGDRYNSINQRAAYWSELMERAASLPGIAISASVSDLPIGLNLLGERGSGRAQGPFVLVFGLASVYAGAYTAALLARRKAGRE